MVWKLGAIKDASTGARKYCFAAPGAYKIGRKDCAVCIATDKTVSRIHAEIVVLPPSPGVGGGQSKAILKDLSKFGTFVNKKDGGKPVFELPGGETSINDGDEITFGTGSSTFRVFYEHFLFCVSAPRPHTVISKANTVLGAQCLEKWNDECTHLLVEDGSSVTEMVLAAVGQRKPVVSVEWLETIASSASSLSEIPKCSSFSPTLKLELNDASEVRIAQPDARLAAYEGIVFLATSLDKYYYREKLNALVSAAGGSLHLIPRKTVPDSKHQQVLIVPELADTPDDFSNFRHLQRIREQSLIVGILCGCKNVSAFFTQQSVEESQSTDATVDLQDTEDDADSVAETPPKKIERRERSTSPISRLSSVKAKDDDAEFKELSKSTRKSLKEIDEQNLEVLEQATCPRPSFTNKSAKKEDTIRETDDKEYGEVRYMVGLVVQQSRKEEKRPENKEINFKNFRRVGAVPGNSFQAFVPFAPDGYRETSYFDDIEEAMQLERKKAAEEELANQLFEIDDITRKKRPSSRATTTSNKRQKK